LLIKNGDQVHFLNEAYPHGNGKHQLGMNFVPSLENVSKKGHIPNHGDVSPTPFPSIPW